MDNIFILAIVATTTVLIVVFIIGFTYHTDDIITTQSSNCSSITSYSDKARCLEARIDLLEDRITELEK